ncbi:MAG: SDR family NAD(P)-dependent oxidoreductase [Lachnospiraceae bacterium]|nr:SDR family NAD(P)-dependent oxidoreductase [Lachnospiraceae bacterium]
MKIVMVTGASSGIGAEFVRQLDQSFSRIDEIWMIARNAKKMEEIAATLQNKARIIGLDLEKKEQRKELEILLETESPEICMLVNCAGFGLMGDFEQLDIEEQLNMVELNCKALTAVTYMAIPYMVRNGRMIQLASAAAFVPQAHFTVYAATKSYVLSFSRALQEELIPKEIFVTAVCPGPVDTPFFDRAETNGHTLALKKHFTVSPEQVVRDALIASKRRKTVAVCSFPMKLFRILCKVVPHSWILEIVENYDKG